MDTQHLVAQLYSAFNERNIDACLQLMTDDVLWPKASEGGQVVGKDGIRAYWTRQWAEYDPHVEPVQVSESDKTVDVTVHQVVKSVDGQLLFDGVVTHSFTLVGGRVSRMDILSEGQSAFVRR